MSKVNVVKARALLLVVSCSLLISAATASAECAWVLWNGTVAVPVDWQIYNAYPTAKECSQDLAVLAQVYKNGGYRVTADARSALYKKENERGGYLNCLPDTVDPRGPKGK